eukprot:scaffold1378_cov257-Pinguiococcus_pyrenoidosus.AAC.2
MRFSASTSWPSLLSSSAPLCSFRRLLAAATVACPIFMIFASMPSRMGGRSRGCDEGGYMQIGPLCSVLMEPKGGFLLSSILQHSAQERATVDHSKIWQVQVGGSDLEQSGEGRFKGLRRCSGLRLFSSLATSTVRRHPHLQLSSYKRFLWEAAHSGEVTRKLRRAT